MRFSILCVVLAIGIAAMAQQPNPRHQPAR